MAYNKFISKSGEVFLDLTSDTVVENDVASGKIFHKANGEQAIGTAVFMGGDLMKIISQGSTILIEDAFAVQTDDNTIQVGG